MLIFTRWHFLDFSKIYEKNEAFLNARNMKMKGFQKHEDDSDFACFFKINFL
jgi:hypothetical protein